MEKVIGSKMFPELTLIIFRMVIHLFGMQWYKIQPSTQTYHRLILITIFKRHVYIVLKIIKVFFFHHRYHLTI